MMAGAPALSLRLALLARSGGRQEALLFEKRSKNFYHLSVKVFSKKNRLLAFMANLAGSAQPFRSP